MGVAQLVHAAEDHSIHVDGGHHAHLDSWQLSAAGSSAAPLGGVRRAARLEQAISFVVGPAGSKGSVAEAKKAIAEANKADLKLWDQIKEHRDAIPGKRKALDEVMQKRMEQLRPLCKEYLTHRAELAGLAGEQCLAAQGHVNAAEVSDKDGPHGCLADDTGKFESIPKELPEAKCRHGFRQLLCTERLRELIAGTPAPGVAEAHAEEEAINATKGLKKGGARHAGELRDWSIPSMDKQVRDWCHPVFSLRGKHISEELARGVDSTEDAGKDPEDEGAADEAVAGVASDMKEA